jgi:hypothetical protein
MILRYYICEVSDIDIYSAYPPTSLHGATTQKNNIVNEMLCYFAERITDWTNFTVNKIVRINLCSHIYFPLNNWTFKS